MTLLSEPEIKVITAVILITKRQERSTRQDNALFPLIEVGEFSQTFRPPKNKVLDVEGKFFMKSDVGQVLDTRFVKFKLNFFEAIRRCDVL